MQTCAENPGHRPGLDGIIGRRGRAMQVEVADFARVDAGTRQRTSHGQLRPQALRMWRGHVVGVAGFTVAAQLQRARGRVFLFAFDQGETAGLAQ